MNVVIKNARVADGLEAPIVDIGIEDGRIAAIGTGLASDALTFDAGGRRVSPGFVETHIHLDKSCLLDRCASESGDLSEAIQAVAAAKRDFTPEDVYERAKRTLEKSILNGTTHMRTHLEVDPVVGLRSLEGILPLVDEYKWAIDIEVCVFPQEGLLNNPGTDELIVEGLERGGRVVGAAPYTDSDPHGQIDRIFEIAGNFDIDIDMHLDFGHDPGELDLEYVCRLTDEYGYGGRVTIGHVTRLSAIDSGRFRQTARRLADAGVAVTVLPATDLFLMGRHQDNSVMRGVTAAHRLLHEGVNCSLSSNNVLNPFTPFGDCSLIRMANLYANVCQVGATADVAECFEMITGRSARILRRDDYGLEVGKSADLVVLDCFDRASAVAELAQPLLGFKRGRLTFQREPAMLNRPA